MRQDRRRHAAHGRRGCPSRSNGVQSLGHSHRIKFSRFFSCLLTCLPQVCHGWLLWIERMQLTRGDTQHCHRLAPQDRRPRGRPEGPRSGWPIPPVRSDLVGEADKLLAATQPARGAAAGAFAVSTGVAAGYVERRLSPGSFTDHRNGSGSAPATDYRQSPPAVLPAMQTRRFADHHPVWRCEAGADVRRADGACMMGSARAARSAPHNTASTQTSPYSASIAEIYRRRGCKLILKEPHARAA